MSSEIRVWFTKTFENNKFCERWITAFELYNEFLSCRLPTSTKEISYQLFLKQINILEINNKFVTKRIERSYGEIRLYKYYIINTPCSNRDKYTTRRSSSNVATINNNINHTSPTSTSDEPRIPITPIDTTPNDNNNIISDKSKMSIEHSRPLEEHTNLSIPLLDDSITNNSIPTTIHSSYAILNQYGIPTDLSIPSNKIVVQAILRDIEKLNNSFDLSFPRLNNNIVKPFFIPSGLASQRSFNAWDSGKKGLTAILSFVSNGIINASTSAPVAVEYMLRKVSKVYPQSFHNQANISGYDKPVRMNVVETAAVLSEVGVGDKKILNTLQKHLKAKFNGRQIFCPRRDLNRLTIRIPRIICNHTLFEREDGLKKESIGVACLDSIEAIRLDMERYIHSKYQSSNIFRDSVANIPLFSTNTPSHNSGTYVLFGTDHGQGTSQFMMRILLGSSSYRRTQNRPDFNTRDISYATIKCRTDPYEILNLTVQETNKCIHYLTNHKLIALSDDVSLI